MTREQGYPPSGFRFGLWILYVMDRAPVVPGTPVADTRRNWTKEPAYEAEQPGNCERGQNHQQSKRNNSNNHRGHGATSLILGLHVLKIARGCGDRVERHMRWVKKQ